MTDRKLMQQALDAMNKVAVDELLCNAAHHPKKDRHGLGDPCPIAEQFHYVREALLARLAQPDPEPVAWLDPDMGAAYTSEELPGDDHAAHGFEPLYTAPPQREWQGLTDEEIRNEAKNHVFDESFFSGAVWARGKIMGKNHG